jgi:hypothetical protein
MTGGGRGGGCHGPFEFECEASARDPIIALDAMHRSRYVSPQVHFCTNSFMADEARALHFIWREEFGRLKWRENS